MHKSTAPISFVALLGLLISLAGCRPLPPSKPVSQWTPQEARGATVFQQKCARCHAPNSTRSGRGPGLQAITKASSVPFGSPLNDEKLRLLIRNGRGAMPARQISEGELQDLLAYLHTL